MATATNARTSARIRGLLAERRQSQGDLFVHAGLSDRTGARRMAGTSSWTLDELSAVADFLEVQISDLVAPQNRQPVAS